MHELGIVYHIIRDVENVARANGVSRVSSVTLLLGEVSGVVPDLLLDAWRWAADKKPITQGAELIVEPAEAGRLLDTIRLWAGRKPILGVCLGEQAIGEVFGARLRNLEEVFHGVQSPVRIVHPDDYLFRGLPQEIHVGRYHSWVVDSDGLPDCLEVTAVSREGYIMALRHKDYDVRGIQFHPESVLTPDGQRIIANWLSAETSTNVQPLNENQQ